MMTVRRSNESQGGRGRRWSGSGWLAAAALALSTAGIITSCEDEDEAEVVSAAEVYPYDYYYPADLAVSDAYWMDPWYTDSFYYSKLAQTTSGATQPGAVMRLLANAGGVCGSQVQITPRTSTGCLRDGGVGDIRTGALISFNGCMLANGGRIDGTVDVTGAHALSDQDCDADTTVNVNYTARYTNLTYTTPDGARVVVPDATNVGNFTRKGNSGPTGLSVTMNGSLVRYDASNTVTSNHTFSGSRNYRYIDGGYVVNGSIAVQDALAGSQTTLTGVELTRTRDCCRPTSGNIIVAGREQDTDTWSWGPSCGQATLNGVDANLPACP
jgi:hypothetical protein